MAQMSSYLGMLAPEYNNYTFSDIFHDDQSFYDYLSGTGILDATITEAFLKRLWFMLYSYYGNSPIAGSDENRWKTKLATTVEAYAPTYIKKDEIQKALRALDLDDLREGYKSIFNRAINPSAEPTTDNTEELPYLNEQNVNKTKKNKADAYATLWDILKTNLLEDFLKKFSKLFSKVATEGNTIIYESEEDI